MAFGHKIPRLEYMSYYLMFLCILDTSNNAWTGWLLFALSITFSRPPLGQEGTKVGRWLACNRHYDTSTEAADQFENASIHQLINVETSSKSTGTECPESFILTLGITTSPTAQRFLSLTGCRGFIGHHRPVFPKDGRSHDTIGPPNHPNIRQRENPHIL